MYPLVAAAAAAVGGLFLAGLGRLWEDALDEGLGLADHALLPPEEAWFKLGSKKINW